MNIKLVMYVSIVKNFIIFISESVVITPICPPAEEGKEYTLIFKWIQHREQITELHIVREATAVATCSSLTRCTDDQQNFIRTTSTLNETNSERTISVKIFNLHRKNPNTTYTDWSVSKQGRDVSHCRVHFYTKLNITCEQYINDKNLSFTCKASPTYHKVECEIFKIPLMDIANGCLENAVQFSNKFISASHIYYDAECILTIPDVCLGYVQYAVSINVYPNITNTRLDKEFGSYKSVIVDLPHPISVLKGCALVVEENAEVICTCERSDNNKNNVSIAWFDNRNFLINSSKGLHILIFNATRGSKLKNLGFFCKPINKKLWKLSQATLQYSPNIISRITSMSCRQESSNEILKLTCTSGRVFPPGHCEFRFELDYINDLIEGRDAVLNSHETVSNDPVYYKTSCILNLKTNNLSSGLYDLVVTMYPRANNDENYISFGTNMTLSIKIEVRKDIYPILPVFGVNTVLVSLMFLYFYIKRRGKNKTQDNYDVINDEHHSLAVIHASTGTGRFDEHPYEQFCERSQNHEHVKRLDGESNPYDYVDE